MRFREFPTTHSPFKLSLKVEKLWGEDNIVEWHLNEDVNILTGINGSGKSTLLRLLYAAFCNDFSEFSGTDVFENLEISYFGDSQKYTKDRLKMVEKSQVDEWDFSEYNNSLEAIFHEDTTISYINTFDVILQEENVRGERVKTSLDSLLYTKGREYVQYLRRLEKRMQSENADSTVIYQAKNRFLEILNISFKDTQKQVKEKSVNSSFYFEKISTGKSLTPFQFSSGEKQFFFLLLSALVQDNMPTIFILDEPEISLHPEWQLNLIKYIRELNPKATVVVATHSPEMLINGWLDKEFLMENLTSPLSPIHRINA